MLFICCLCSEAPSFNVLTCRLIPLPLFLVVLGVVALSLSSSVLLFPSRLLLIRLSIGWRSVRGDVGQGFLSILDILCIRHRDMRWLSSHKDFSGVPSGRESSRFCSCRDVQDLCRTVIVVVRWKNYVVLIRQEFHHAN